MQRSSMSDARVPRQMPDVGNAPCVPKPAKRQKHSHNQGEPCPDGDCTAVLFKRGKKIVHCEGCKFWAYVLEHSRVKNVFRQNKIVGQARVPARELTRLNKEGDTRCFLRYYLTSLSE